MHSPNIALALADARVADLQRATTHTTATAPPRRHSRTLALLGVAATAAISALAPTGASARPIEGAATPASAHVNKASAHDLRAFEKTSSLAGAPAARVGTSGNPADVLRHAGQARHDLRSPDARDAAEGRGTFNSPQVVVVKAQPRPALTSGIDWGDAGIGAGSLLAMSLLALGGTLLITHRRRAHGTVA